MFAADGKSVFELPNRTNDREPPLAPVRSWSAKLQQFSELFPPERILAEVFFEKISDPNVWRMLNEQHLTKTDIIITRNEPINFTDFFPKEELPDEEKVSHKSVDHISVTDIVERVKIMDQVRRTRDRTRLFWRFLTEWLVKKDGQGLETAEAKCECGESHKYYPAAWLMPVRNNRWIQQRGGQVPPGARSIANLLRGSEWEPSSLNENSAVIKLLKAIDVTVLDLMQELTTENDDQRKVQDKILIEILGVAGNSLSILSRIPELVPYIDEDDEVLLSHLETRQKKRHIADKNRRLGQRVEDLVKESLEHAGFSVCRTGTGSDFEVSDGSYDLITLDVAQNDYGKSWLVEVKSTRYQSVHVSSTQTETAIEEKEKFLLCVVPIEPENIDPDLETVKRDMRFIKNIGGRVERLDNDLKGLEELRNEINDDASPGVELVIDLGKPGICVKKSVWENEGFTLENLAENLK